MAQPSNGRYQEESDEHARNKKKGGYGKKDEIEDI
jgi:hypothetical protein